MTKYKLKKNDQVIVTTGSHKGKTGKILTMFPSEGKAIVEGVNARTRNKKGQSRETVLGKIHISNIALQDPKDPTKPTKLGFKFQSDKKLRYAKKSDSTIDE